MARGPSDDLKVENAGAVRRRAVGPADRQYELDRRPQRYRRGDVLDVRRDGAMDLELLDVRVPLGRVHDDPVVDEESRPLQDRRRRSAARQRGSSHQPGALAASG
jgi:hypothetical protein